MRIETIACNQCGAPLEIPHAAQFVTCNHCAASLAVHRTASVTYTDFAEKIARNTENIAREVAELRQQAAIERLDREWQREREKYLIRSKNGATREPGGVGAAFGSAIMGIFGLVVLVAAASGAGDVGGILVVLGFLVLILGFGSIVSERQKQTDLERARAQYEERRRQLQIGKAHEKPA